ncbi:MAG: hypothetical protein ACYDC3_16550 [Candidatus Binataceae bacterium]
MELTKMLSSRITKRALSAMAGICAIAAISLPITAAAKELNNNASVQAYASHLGDSRQFTYGSDVAPPRPKSNSIAARARRLLKGEDGPVMYCDKDAYRCDPNPAYYGNSAENYQPYPYYYYADGFTKYSYPGVPAMGGF